MRVLLADDQPTVLERLHGILEPEYEIVGEARDGLALVAASGKLKPDIIVADISMPVLSGIEAVRRIRKRDRGVRVIFFTMHADIVYAKAALNAGGSAVVLKSSGADELLTGIREALRGRKFVTPAIAPPSGPVAAEPIRPGHTSASKSRRLSHPH